MSRQPLDRQTSTLRAMLYRRGNIIEDSKQTKRRLNGIEAAALTEESAVARFQRSGEQRDFDGWGQENVSASQTAVVLARWDSTWRNGEKRFVRDGSVTSIQVTLSASRTAGTLTVELYIDGAASGFSVEINDEETDYAEGTAAPNEYAFTAGQPLTLRVTTDGSWAPTTADVEVAIQVATDY